jgi:hypothetical protein
LVILIIRPNAVDRYIGKGITVNQATGIGLIVGIVLNDFSLKDAEKDFVERKVVGLGFFVSVVCNSYPVMTYRINDVFDSHGLPFRWRLGRAAFYGVAFVEPLAPRCVDPTAPMARTLPTP